MTIGEWIACVVCLVIIAGLIWLGHASGAWYSNQGDE